MSVEVVETEVLVAELVTTDVLLCEAAEVVELVATDGVDDALEEVVCGAKDVDPVATSRVVGATFDAELFPRTVTKTPPQTAEDTTTTETSSASILPMARRLLLQNLQYNSESSAFFLHADLYYRL